jgi:hypothetical protein
VVQWFAQIPGNAPKALAGTQHSPSSRMNRMILFLRPRAVSMAHDSPQMSFM